MQNGERMPVAGLGTRADGPDATLLEAFQLLYSCAARDLNEALVLLHESDRRCASLEAELERSRNRRIVRLADKLARSYGDVRRRVLRGS
ncbi:MAG: hypothetical protein ACTHNQ_01200 [Microbacterium sp.]|uniref:hypothetical protein n=1 Tax=Microbacterium sp. TaxID=51671 RepID=UPI003F7F054C